MTAFLKSKTRNQLEIIFEIMCEAPKKSLGICFLLAKFYKRWCTIMIMLESSEGGGARGDEIC